MIALPPRQHHPLLVFAAVALFMGAGALIGAGLMALLLTLVEFVA